ncbi:SGNH/GDSL hydrolase family protein [Acidicapsa dinghuensis]|uniref:SGNH/GDSL hydrolase family protein n=1 Tax=Acidicapsa dinghuensis TaxID=2218256 RepID=A0ABW1ELC0_9BACT|nr:SGNH/GDSL hydrolase family protein [Acidicapsa dinghuensis]
MSLAAQDAAKIPEEIEWTWEVRPAHADAKLPNVLLLGDSITRNYFPEVTQDLTGVANVYLMASSTCVGDPRIEHQIAEFATMEGVRFQVVHFNNGMHGWGYSEAQYKAAFPAFMRTVRALTLESSTLIWASTTPVRIDKEVGPTNARVDERNKIALALITSAKISLDDQHALMMEHRDLYKDDIHFNDAGSKIQGDQAAAQIRAALSMNRLPKAQAR